MQKLQEELLRDFYIEKYKLASILPESILPELILVEFNQGEYLCSQGEPSEWVFFLLKGKVKIYTATSDGKRLVVAFNTPFELFGDIELIQQLDYTHSIEAVGNVHTFRMKTSELRRMLENSTFSTYLLTTISRKFYTKSKTLSFHLLNKVEIRLSSYLLSMMNDEFGEPDRIEIKSTELKDIAEFIGTSYRHLNRILSAFEAEGIVERKKETIHIRDLTLLKNKAQENIYEIQ
ncbi:Crp/Fnr family transcriptional regulator [Ureibacillus sp. NPDC094379]